MLAPNFFGVGSQELPVMSAMVHSGNAGWAFSDQTRQRV